MGFFSGLLSGGLGGAVLGSVVPGIGTALGAGLGAISGGISSWQSDRRASDAFNRNAVLSWDMWNATNNYNSPVNQMRRFKAAGLNPNLIYGGMSNVSQPSFVRSEPAVESGNSVLDTLRYLQGFDLQERELALKSAQTLGSLELAKQSSLRSEKELALHEKIADQNYLLKSSMLPLEKELLKSRIAALDAGLSDAGFDISDLTDYASSIPIVGSMIKKLGRDYSKNARNLERRSKYRSKKNKLK